MNLKNDQAERMAQLEAVDPLSSTTLVVAWKVGQNMHLGTIPIGQEVKAELSGVVGDCLMQLKQREHQAWSPEADLTPEVVLVLPQEDVGTAPPMSPAHRPKTFLQTLRDGAALRQLGAQELPSYDLTAYALIVGDSPEGRAVFLRKTNARRGLKKGRLFTALHDALVRVQEPLFAFDTAVDIALIGDSVYVLSQNTFASLFRQQVALTEQIPRWIDSITDHIPVEAEGLTLLRERAIKDSRLRQRLEAIAQRGHLVRVDMERIKSAMTDHGMDPDELFTDDGELVLDDDNIPHVLHFLNEDLFVGSLSESPFRADKKSVR